MTWSREIEESLLQKCTYGNTRITGSMDCALRYVQLAIGVRRFSLTKANHGSGFQTLSQGKQKQVLLLSKPSTIVTTDSTMHEPTVVLQRSALGDYIGFGKPKRGDFMIGLLETEILLRFGLIATNKTCYNSCCLSLVK